MYQNTEYHTVITVSSLRLDALVCTSWMDSLEHIYMDMNRREKQKKRKEKGYIVEWNCETALTHLTQGDEERIHSCPANIAGWMDY